MNWLTALLFAKDVDCPDALAVAEKAGSTKEPPDDAKARVVCRGKISAGRDDDSCGKDCPKGRR